MKVFTNVQVNEILEKSNSFFDLWLLQDYMNMNKLDFPIQFYKEITLAITRKFLPTHSNIKDEPITD
jgi:hypothetical protein